MRTAIAIDSLLLRDDSIFLLELILNLFPHSEIYTIAHKQGSILGTIETRPIVSSFLTHKAKDISVFRKNFWILPSAVKAIPIHHSIEKVVIISRGYVHGWNLPDHVEKLLYILEWDLVDQRKLGWQKMFAPYVNNWREKALTKFPKILVSSETLKEKLSLPNAIVVPPTFRTEEYSFVKDEDHNFNFTHHLIFTHDADLTELKTIFKILSSKDETIRVLGPDSHLTELKSQFPLIEFGGDHCEATSSLYIHQAKVVWDLSKSFFPAKAFGSLASGRPVIVREGSLQREFLGHGTFFLSDFSEQLINKIYLEVEESYLSFDRRSLRRLGLKWNERLFKSRIFRA